MQVWISEAGLTGPTEAEGWAIVEHRDAYAGARSAHGAFSWDIQAGGRVTIGGHSGLAKAINNRPSGRWMLLADEWLPVIVEVARRADYSNGEAFQAALARSAIAFEEDTLTYMGLSGDVLIFDASQAQSPTVNGAPIDYAPSKASSSLFVDADWNSGVVHVRKGDREKVLDFNL